FYYNVAANNVNPTVVRTTYRAAVNNVTPGRISYNGGVGGRAARPNAADLRYANPQRSGLTRTQIPGQQVAANPQRFIAPANRERPASANSPQGAFSRQGGTRVQAQASPERNVRTHVARTQFAPERNVRTRMTPTQVAPERRPGGAPSHAEPRTY